MRLTITFSHPKKSSCPKPENRLLYERCHGGGTGIHDGLKIRWEQSHAGSIPARGTKQKDSL